jgi:hypothetical protein
MKMKKTDSRIKEIQNAFKNFSLKLICIDIITIFLTFVSMKTGHMSLYKICFLISVSACNCTIMFITLSCVWFIKQRRKYENKEDNIKE